MSKPSDDGSGVSAVKIRKLFSKVTLFSILLLCVGLVLMGVAKALQLPPSVTGVLFDGIYLGALGLMVSALAHFFLDIMYAIFGLLQVKLFPLLGWLLLSVLSLVPLSGIFAIAKLAEGFRS